MINKIHLLNKNFFMLRSAFRASRRKFQGWLMEMRDLMATFVIIIFCKEGRNIKNKKEK
jgi:hypothetical protein